MVENKEVQELFHFLNPALKLLGHKALEGHVLNDESKALENEMTQTLKNFFCFCKKCNVLNA